jgi:beta-lactam-binding protein with PASTA domain
MSMEFLDRLRWAGRLFLLLFILGSAAFLSAITAMRFAIEGRIVKMPDLIGQSLAGAQAELGRKKLGIVVADHVYSPLPADAVVRQSPPPQTQVKVGQRAQVVLSLGPQKMRVPSLIDRSLPAARLQLLSVGLQLGEVSYIYASGEPADLILQQDPLPGVSGLSSPRVSVLVSLGSPPPAFVMPDFSGLLIGQVEQRLVAAGLGRPSVVMVPNAGALVGSIVAQSPAAGSLVDPSTPVELSVASLAQPAPRQAPQKGELGPGGGYAKIPGGGK